MPNVVSEYQFSITSITLNNFLIFVKCPQVGLIWQLRYSWIALDDQRIQVINSFNVDPPQDKVFNHQLLNVDIAIIGLTSLGYGGGQLEFQLSVTELTQNSVSVGISQVTGKFVNLKQIGYQILLLASRDIIDLGQVKFSPTDTSNPINLESNKWFIQPIRGLKYNYGYQFNIQRVIAIGASTLTYKYEKWHSSNDFSQLTLRNIWLSYQLINNQALQCQSLRISQKLDRSQINRPKFFVQI